MSKKYTTNFLEDTNGSTGSANQVLISTPSGIDWVDGSGSGIIGGPYLPLSAGASYPLTDTLYGTKATFGDTNIDVATVTIEGGQAGILDIWRNGTNASYQAIRFRDDTNANTEASIGWGSNQLRLNGTSTIVATTGGSERMRIDSSGNVGIGTTSPGDPLTVIGKIASLGGANNAKNIKIYANDSFGYVVTNASKIYMSTGLQVDSGLIGSYNEDLQLQVSGGTKMYLDSSGNVGIGTTSPDVKLDVNGNNGTAIRISIPQSSPSLGDVLSSFETFSNDTSGGLSPSVRTSVRTITEDVYARNMGLSFGTSGGDGENLERMRIDSSGNVGIGTTLPGFKLDVHGDSTSGVMSVKNAANARDTFRSENAAGTRTFNIGNDANGHANVLIRNSSGITTSYLSGSGDSYINGGDVGIGTTSPADKLEVVGNIRLRQSLSNTETVYISTNARGGGTNDADLRLGNSINGDILTVHNANVGIGTTNPQSKLHLATTGGSTLTIQNTTNSGNAALNFKDEGNNDQFQIYYALGANRSYNLVNGNGLTIYSSQASAEIARFGNASSGYTDSYFTGNVGIGTTSPSTKLEVVDTFSVQRTSTDNEGFYVTVSGADANAIVETFYQEDSGSRYGIRKRYDGSTNLYQEFIHENSTTGTEVYRVDRGTKNTSIANGNVGIGTTSPGYKLDVDGEGRFGDNGGILLTDDSGTSYVRALNNHLNLRTTRDADDIYFSTGTTTTTKMFIKGDTGNVGIGTTNPAKKLTIGGIGAGNTDGLKIEDPSNTAYGAHFSYDDASSTVEIGGVTNNTLNDCISIARDATRTITIDTSERVGIGTTSPSEKLDVNGDARVTGRIYTNAGGLASIGIYGKAIANGWAARYDSNNANFSGFYFDLNEDASMLLRDDAGNVNVYLRSDSSSYINGGNVGIGTTSPTQKLTIKGTDQYVAAEQTNYAWGATNTIGVRMGTDTTAGLLDFRRWAGTNQIHGTALITQVLSDGGYGLDFRVDTKTSNTAATTSRMFLSQSGEVGIGTTSPSEKLHVSNGKAYVTPIAYAANQSAYALKIGAYNNAAFDMGLQAKSTSGGSPYMSFRTTSNDDTLTIWGGAVGVGGIGIPGYTLDVDGQIRGKQYLRLKDTGGTNQFSIRAESTYGTLDNGSKTFNYIASNHLFLVGTAEKMRINSSGNVGIGTTSPSSKLHVKDTSLSGTLAYFEASASAQGTTNVRIDCLQYGSGIAFFRDGTLGSGACSFRNDSNVQVGSIAIGTSSTTYNTSSDYRLKENLTLITDGIDRLKQLKPKRFNFIGETQIVDGFVAHEAKEVVPESVTGEKDEVLLNGDPVYQGIDQSKIVPLLTAALQEAVAKIEDLENRIQTLENK